MENNLLVNLRKYRPRENHDPLENFITEAFSHLLRSSSEAMIALIKLIDEKLDVPISFDYSQYIVSTQENLNNKFPDMVVKWNQSALIFEHKVGSELSENQLENYRNHASDVFSDFRLVLITAREYQHKQNPDCALCWHNIYSMLKDIQGNLVDDRVEWYVQELIELLWAEGLGPVSPINHLSIDHYVEAKALDGQMLSLLSQTLTNTVEWPFNSCLEPGLKNRLNNVEKRIGLEFCRLNDRKERKWAPCVFFGFITDGKDHKLDWVMGERLHIAAVFDFNRIAQDKVKQSECYRNFRDEIKTEVSCLNQSIKSVSHNNIAWSIIDNSTNANTQSVNWYHPLAIVMPMDVFFEGVHQTQEQVELFIHHVSLLQTSIMKCVNFTALISELT